MIWESAEVLYLLWIVPVLGWLALRAARKRREAAERFADAEMAPRITPTPVPGRAWLKAGLFAGGLALLLVAAARPRFGVYFEQVSQKGVDLFVCIDVSRSMLARDVTPDRLGRAKSDVLDLLDYLEGDRVGLIAFAGKPVLACPLTTDQGFFKTVLAELSPASAPRGGTVIGDAIRAALDNLPEGANRDQAVVLITDGEDQDSLPLDAADRAAARGVKVFTVGLGDPDEGGRIPVENARGETVFLQHEGQVVWSRLDGQLLEEIALRTGGAYVPAATSAYDLGRIYDQHLARLTAGEYSTEKRKRYRERFQLFLLCGLVLLALERALPDHPRRNGRPEAA